MEGINKEDQQILEESNVFFNLSSNLLCIIGYDGFFKRLSPSWTTLTGYSLEELLSKPYLTYIHEEDKQQVKNVFENFKGNPGIFEFDVRFVCANGDVKWLLWSGQATVDNRIHSVAHNITSRKIIEQELHEKISALDSFTYLSIHDLKGPLASVQGLVNLAIKDVTDLKAHRYFGMIEASYSKMDLTLNRLVEISRNTRSCAEEEIIDPLTLTNGIIQALKNLPNTSKIKIEAKSEVAHFKSNPPLLLSIIQNLLHNAINYYNPLASSPYITIEWSKAPNGTMLVVKDNGVGMEESIIPKAFDMFYRGNVSSKGSGLGLYIVKNAVEKIKGTIKMETRHLTGTTFTIHLPKL